jgi:hypothetical protein
MSAEGPKNSTQIFALLPRARFVDSHAFRPVTSTQEAMSCVRSSATLPPAPAICMVLRIRALLADDPPGCQLRCLSRWRERETGLRLAAYAQAQLRLPPGRPGTD